MKSDARTVSRTRVALLAAVALAVVCSYLSVRELAFRVAASMHVEEKELSLAGLFDRREMGEIEKLALENIEEGLPFGPHPRHEITHGSSIAASANGTGGESGGETYSNVYVAASAGKKVEEPQSLAEAAGVEGGEPASGGDLCAPGRMMKKTDFWGDPVKWGTGNKVESAAECCSQCLDYKPSGPDAANCNIWVYCEDQELCGAQWKDCWLKHLPFPDGAKPNYGPNVGWTTGIFPSDQGEHDPRVDDVEGDRSYHVVTSAMGAATHWQMRVHYYHFLKQKRDCIEQHGDKCEMGGFTRLLHSGQADDLMDEIPTMVVDPLPKDTPGANKGYVVLNRPYAFVQWVQKADIKERFIVMSEPDHVWLRPVQNPMRGTRPISFPFFYIEPARKDFKHITEQFVGPLTQKQAESIPPIGNSPTFLLFEDMKKVAQTWMDMSIAIINNEEAAKEWGWVQEMYAFTLAIYKNGVTPIDLKINMMAQPPWDTAMQLDADRPYDILHYTYGNDYTLEGEFTPGKYGAWRFDKRSYSSRPPPRALGQPPEKMENDLVRYLINAINEASSVMQDWDEYATTGRSTIPWNGKTFADGKTWKE